jgi:hypothetical protein
LAKQVGSKVKKKCVHCGCNFKPKGDNELVCKPCKIQLRNDSSVHRFEVKYLRAGLLDIRGILLLSPEKIVFEPDEAYFKDKKFELALSKIKDARFASTKEISASRLLLLGVESAVLWPKKSNMISIDYEDEFGILQHPVFEGNDMDLVITELNELRRTSKFPS